MSQPQPPATEFMAAAQAAMNDIQRSRTQAGVSAADPLNPLVDALARTVGVLGKMPAALASTQKAAEDAAVASMGAALGEAMRDLVAQSGAAAARGYQAKWIAICVGVVAVAMVGVGWWSYEQGRAAGVDATQGSAQAIITDVKAGIPALNAWASTILLPNQREQAVWAAKLTPSEADAAKWGLSPEGQMARRLHDANLSIGGVIGIAQCRGGKTDTQNGKQACQVPPAYWMPSAPP